jgi:hypothetical protein
MISLVFVESNPAPRHSAWNAAPRSQLKYTSFLMSHKGHKLIPADVRFTSESGHYCGASKIRSPGLRATTLANLQRDFEGMIRPAPNVKVMGSQIV